ncbi:hypothetical protein M3Y96_00335000 [Aphelenchoides besseyi]|nr:hypothetical protein M3Y96_00335000 [Aphelenchoides besseyi]
MISVDIDRLFGEDDIPSESEVDFTFDKETSHYSLSISDTNKSFEKSTYGNEYMSAVGGCKTVRLNEKNKSKVQRKIRALPYAIVKLRNHVPAFEYKLRSDNMICFSGMHFLSSFYPAAFDINGQIYASVEHYYQATKLYTICGFKQAEQIANCSGAFQAKKYAKETLANHGISSRTLNEWKQTDGLLTLIYAVALKFIQNPNLRELLFATSDKLLVQTHDGDNFYASGTNAEDLEAWIKEHEGEVLKVPCNLVKPVLKYVPLVAKGQNLLGFINMKVRQELLLVNPDHLQDINVVNTILMKLTS